MLFHNIKNGTTVTGKYSETKEHSTSMCKYQKDQARIYLHKKLTLL